MTTTAPAQRGVYQPAGLFLSRRRAAQAGVTQVRQIVCQQCGRDGQMRRQNQFLICVFCYTTPVSRRV